MSWGGGYTSLGSEDRGLRATRRREIMAGSALVVSILGFVGQTELLGHVSSKGYQKPMFVMYITHSCMLLLLPLQILVLWLYKRDQSFQHFYHRHTSHLRATAQQITRVNAPAEWSPLKYFLWVAVILGMALNFAGASWYIAVNMTTTSDLTAIYNCSAFFAYFFSVLLLKENWHGLKALSVLLSVLGVVIVAYMGPKDSEVSTTSKRRALGNAVIAVGTVLYGLYEVLYKRIACPPQSVSARKQAAFANFTGSAIGVSTLTLMWPVLIVLHLIGWETFAWPSWSIFKWLLLSIICNVSFSGSFLVLMSLTSPVLGSVSALLATFMVPVVELIVFHRGMSAWELGGGVVIIVAFLIMTWASRHDFEEDGIDE